MRTNLLRNAGLGLLALTAAFSAASCGGDSKTTLVVGMECAYVPFNWTETVKTDRNVAISNQAGTYAEGYDVQIAKKIAEGMNMDLEVKALAWDSLIPSLKTSQIDLIIAGMSNTEERRQSIDFTNGYYTSEEVILVRADSTYANATKLHDFTGAKLGAQLGTLYVDFANQAAQKVGALVNDSWNKDNVPGILMDLKAGRIDGTVVELPVAQGIVANDSTFKIIRLDSTDTFEASPEDVEVCIGVRKGYEHTARINEILGTISTSERNNIMQECVSLGNAAEIVSETLSSTLDFLFNSMLSASNI